MDVLAEYDLQNLGEWTAMVAIVVIFLRYMANSSKELRGIGDSCHAHSEQQAKAYNEGLNQVVAANERNFQRISDSMDKATEKTGDLTTTIQQTLAEMRARRDAS